MLTSTRGGKHGYCNVFCPLVNLCPLDDLAKWAQHAYSAQFAG
ncbi:hypothetical protein FX988_03494 [Paraglaciecola mesophila]|uniref:Uncharacterized protein n=1 Tax=Paraglaciecola mesophila TaxID=197222 RepID=A0A857JMX3_9ALTE|nr:hypothetical protein FX988_03494 [Paraglaciecola mesophila]